MDNAIQLGCRVTLHYTLFLADETVVDSTRDAEPITIQIGSGVKNALRIVEKGISDCHLCLYQKAERLMAQNTSGNPVLVNGLPLQPKAKQGLVLPCVIALAENVKLSLSVLRPDDGAATERSEGHEPRKQQQ